jgi:hypothetical protein
LIGSTSNDRICRSTKPDTLAIVRMATAYHACAGVTERGLAESEEDEEERRGDVTSER